jgi:biopolymer transport protein ExbB/TolQ
MNYKKWLFSGIIIFIVSILVGILGTVWGIYNSFDALKTNEGASGIGEVGAGLENAVFASAFSLIGSLIGLILIVIGGVKAYRQRKEPN